MQERLKHHFNQLRPTVDFCALRFVHQQQEHLHVRKGRVDSITSSDSQGIMITVMHNGGLGYGATGRLDRQGMKQAIHCACQWAALSARRAVFDYSNIVMPCPEGNYTSAVKKPWESESLQTRLDRLKSESDRLKISDTIVNWGASLSRFLTESTYITHQGGEVQQITDSIIPTLYVTAFNGEVQHRHLAGSANVRQGGLESMDLLFTGKADVLAQQVLVLLSAPNCPEDTRSLLLMPDQMCLQIHESIGHPLELDRILGDERNYAGTSFVTPDMFGSYQYGSHLLNVSFDPTIPSELASYAFDDDGLAAHKVMIIENGRLKCPLGGTISQARANLPGVACTRAQSWNRPPQDRMANLNVEAGKSALKDMIASIERGVVMESNRSWSIDDSRNKFQFGCEWGQLIENGKLTTVVKNPNYRGISASFWRNLSAVGNAGTVGIHGSPFCGKAEPNQLIHVGHASPACVFDNVDVFGG